MAVLGRARVTIVKRDGGIVRSEFEVDRAVEQYSDMIRRICLYQLKNATDTEDVFQTVFLKYLLYPKSFDSPEHEKAWFIRVTLNACRDHLKSLFRRHTLPLEELGEEVAAIPPEQHQVLDAGIPPPKSEICWAKRKIQSIPFWPEGGRCCGKRWEVICNGTGEESQGCFRLRKSQ